MNYETPLTTLVWLTSIISVGATYAVSLPDDSRSRWRSNDVVEAFDDYHLRHSGGRDYSGAGEGIHVCVESAHVKEVVSSSKEWWRFAEYIVRIGGR